MPLYAKKLSICQDRLGTNIGKTPHKNVFFSQRYVIDAGLSKERCFDQISQVRGKLLEPCVSIRNVPPLRACVCVFVPSLSWQIFAFDREFPDAITLAFLWVCASLQLESLQTILASKASAKQRQGRAGRVGPGLCFRMYPRDWWDNSQVPTQGVSELQRSPLERLVLQTLVLELGAQETSFLCHCLLKRRLFAKTGSGQAQETVE